MSFGAICRTRMLRAKAGVPMSVEKWWKKQRLAEGEITQHINANEQHVLLPWLKTFPKKLIDRAPTYIYPISAAIAINIIVVITVKADHDEDVSHRY